jgi:hypothetical protein
VQLTYTLDAPTEEVGVQPPWTSNSKIRRTMCGLVMIHTDRLSLISTLRDPLEMCTAYITTSRYES